MTITASYVSQVTIGETLTGPFVGTDSGIVINGMNRSETLTALTTIPATKQAAFQKAMSGGNGTIDLTSLPGLTAEETVNGTGLKVRVAKFANPSTNGNDITVTAGASNGIDLLGVGFSITLSPGQEHTFFLDDNAPTIASGDRTIDIAGTLAQVLNVLFVMG